MRSHVLYFIFFTVTAATVIYALSLHAALPISGSSSPRRSGRAAALAALALVLIGVAALALLGHSSSKRQRGHADQQDRKSTRLNSSHVRISYAVFCLKKKKQKEISDHQDISQS